jgi:hypothetical protein
MVGRNKEHNHILLLVQIALQFRRGLHLLPLKPGVQEQEVQIEMVLQVVVAEVLIPKPLLPDLLQEVQ